MPTDPDPIVLLSRVPTDGSTIGNGALSWDEARYTAAKDALVANGTLLKGQGRGGTVHRSTGTQQTLLFFNTSPLDLKRLMGDQDHIGENLRSYIQAFSPAVRDIFESFEIHTQIDRLANPQRRVVFGCLGLTT